MEGEGLELTWTGKVRREKVKRPKEEGKRAALYFFGIGMSRPSHPCFNFSNPGFRLLCLPGLTSPRMNPPPLHWSPALVPSQPGADGRPGPPGREGCDSQRERPWWGPAWHSSACRVAAAGRGDPSSRCRMVLKPSLYSRRTGPSTCSSANSWHRKGPKSSPLLKPWPHTALQICLTGSSSSESVQYRPSLSPLPPPPQPFVQN